MDYKALLPICLLAAILFCSCKKQNPSVGILVRAQSIVENNPQEALLLLDSIPHPQEMDKNHYMQYIVARVQARYKTYQDIKNDTLIVEAYKYFDDKNDPEKSALAHYYTSCVYNQKGELYKDLEHSRQTLNYAKKAKDNLLIAKSQQSIAQIYNDINLLDSAVVNYKQALHYYSKADNALDYKLEIIKFIGAIYRSMINQDSAYCYFNKGFELSKQYDNKSYQTTFKHLLGMTYSSQGNYEKAANYMKEALVETQNPEELRRISLSLLVLYNNKNQSDSATYYATRLEESLPEITYPYTLQELYMALADYYEKRKDYARTLYYGKLLKQIEKKIYEDYNVKRVSETEQKYQSVLKKKEIDSLYMRNRLLVLSAALLIMFVVALTCFKIRYIRLKAAERDKLLQAQLEIQKIRIENQTEIVGTQSRSLEHMQQIYRNIINEWCQIDKEVQNLVKEFGAAQEPQLYQRIKTIIEDFRQNTNAHLVELAKDYLKKQPYGQSAIMSLKEKELLLFMLYRNGYERNEVAVLLGVHPSKQNMLLRKMEVRNKLLKAGMPIDEIEKVLFAEDK